MGEELLQSTKSDGPGNSNGKAFRKYYRDLFTLSQTFSSFQEAAQKQFPFSFRSNPAH
jgi:hypothetical protein